jgi:protein-S-isoprenylcysteine O-methyltransferase Ste14
MCAPPNTGLRLPPASSAFPSLVASRTQLRGFGEAGQRWLAQLKPDPLGGRKTVDWLAVAIAFVCALGAWCILRVRREYLHQDRLSPPSVIGVWVLYVSHFAVTAVVALTSRWSMPLHDTIAIAGGTLLLAVGGFLFLAGIISFRSFWRISGMDTSTLVTTGAYRWSRNPQNVGWALFLVGLALIGRSALALLLAALFWISFRAYVPAEEKFLEHLFGAEYRGYRARSHRYLGPPRKPAV